MSRQAPTFAMLAVAAVLNLVCIHAEWNYLPMARDSLAGLWNGAIILSALGMLMVNIVLLVILPVKRRTLVPARTRKLVAVAWLLSAAWIVIGMVVNPILGAREQDWQSWSTDFAWVVQFAIPAVIAAAALWQALRYARNRGGDDAIA